MASGGLPEAFRSLRGLAKLASDHETRDPVVTYYTKMYMVQKGMEIDRSSPDCLKYLSQLMGELEDNEEGFEFAGADSLEYITNTSLVIKGRIKDSEPIQNEVVGQVHMENAALKLFAFGDNEDRAGHFSVKLVKVFHSCSLMIDVLRNFGELSDEVSKCQKYAKWKAAYIHQCLQTGQTPIPGPLTDEGDEENAPQPPDMSAYQQPGPSRPAPGPSPASYNQPGPSYGGQNTLPTPGAHAPPTTPAESPPGGAAAPPAQPSPWQPPPNPAGVSLTPAQYQMAMKWCKYAGSALQYQDSKTAIENLNKALRLLTTGQE